LVIELLGTAPLHKVAFIVFTPSSLCVLSATGIAVETPSPQGAN
jgi:hypothetical protein